MFYIWACPRRPIGTSLGLDWDENSYLGYGYDQESLDYFGFLFHVLIDLNGSIQLNNVLKITLDMIFKHFQSTVDILKCNLVTDVVARHGLGKYISNRQPQDESRICNTNIFKSTWNKRNRSFHRVRPHRLQQLTSTQAATASGNRAVNQSQLREGIRLSSVSRRRPKEISRIWWTH